MRGDRELPLTLPSSGGLSLLLLLASVIAACGEVPPLEERPLRGGEFVCVDGTCTQRELALPDDGDWECMDQSGLVVCRGGHVAAGVAAGPRDDAFVCGPLTRDESGRRVCVDTRADRPSAEGWRCTHDRDHQGPFAGLEVRRCVRDDAPQLGARCEATCPRGMRCDEGRCVMARDDAPDCWLDADCEGGATCVLAHCSSPS